MDLSNVLTGRIHASPETGIQEFLRYIIVRTNFVPGVRHVIGWRGLKDSAHNSDAWTARIDGCRGVFGIFFERLEVRTGWTTGIFGLNYFPHPEEDRVESLSIQAGALTQAAEYHSQLRDFMSFPPFIDLFNIGSVKLSLKHTGDAVELCLESITRQRVIARDGVSLAIDGQPTELVKPGGYDQDFPSFDTALAFFKVLAASVTFNLAEPPVVMDDHSRPGTIKTYDAAGTITIEPSDSVWEKHLSLRYGQADIGHLAEKAPAEGEQQHRRVLWRDGESVNEKYRDALWWSAHRISDYKTIDKDILGIDDRPQFIVVTGYLGSGKTSFLQHFIEHQNRNNRFVAVIQNEIGEVGLDGKLLDHDYAVTEIDEGCICCTLIGNVKKALHQILTAFHPDYIVLETTGLANPFNLLDELSEAEELVKFDSVTTVVDGLNMEKTLNESEIAHDQIKAADIVLLNKTDLLTDSRRKRVEKSIRAINSFAPIIATDHGDINPTLLYGIDPISAPESADRRAVSKANHSHLQDGIQTHKISFPDPVDRSALIATLDSLPKNIFRIKGVLDIGGNKTPRLLQFVAGRYEMTEFRNQDVTERFLVFIGQNIDKRSIESLFRAHIFPN